MTTEAPNIIDASGSEPQEPGENATNSTKNIEESFEKTQEGLSLPFVIKKQIVKQKPGNVLFFGSSSISSLALCAIRMGDDIPKCYGSNAGGLDYSRSGRRMLDSRTLYNNANDKSKGTFKDPSIIDKFTEIISETDGDKVIVLNGGFNDIFYKKESRELSNIETELKNAFTRIIEMAHQKGMQVLMLTIPIPSGGHMANNDKAMAVAKNINNWLLENLDTDVVIDVNSEIFASMRKPDGHHLNNQGLQAVYRTIRLLTMKQKD